MQNSFKNANLISLRTKDRPLISIQSIMLYETNICPRFIGNSTAVQFNSIDYYNIITYTTVYENNLKCHAWRRLWRFYGYCGTDWIEWDKQQKKYFDEKKKGTVKPKRIENRIELAKYDKEKDIIRCSRFSTKV